MQYLYLKQAIMPSTSIRTGTLVSRLLFGIYTISGAFVDSISKEDG
jgi:surface polysaccharide O-acyltransferase-like enzyme